MTDSLILKKNFEELYIENCPALIATAMRYVHDRKVAEDIVHDSWIIIFTNLDNLRSEDKLLPWMKGIVKNLSLKYLDNEKRHPSTGITGNQENIAMDESESCLPPIPFEDLMSMIESLPKRYGEVFCCSVLNGMSHQEIGVLLGISPHSSSSDLSRAKKILEKKVKKYLLMTLAILLPVSILVLRNNGSKPVEPDGAAIAQKEPQFLPEQASGTVVLPEHLSVPEYQPDTTMIESAAPMVKLLPALEVPATIKPAAATSLHTGGIAVPLTAKPDHRPERMNQAGGWTMLLGLSGMAGLSSVTLANTVSLADYSVAGKTSDNLIFRNWSDYSNYVLSNSPVLNEYESKTILEILNNNMTGKDSGLEETQHHYRPLTIRLSADKHLGKGLSVESGLGFTYLKSEFENNLLGYLGNREQKLYYLGIPLKLKYTVLSLDRLSLYLSGGGELDIPVYGRQTVTGAVSTNIRGSFMGSLEMSAGVQYGISSHLNAYVEVGARYNITGTPAFATYYSAHPLMVSTPFGLRWQF